MSTRSSIAILRKNGNVESIYCHYDGYLDHNGTILNHFYIEPRKVNSLIELGDISSLGVVVNPDSSMPHDFDIRQSGVTLAYSRDRGEDNTEKKVFENLDEYKMGFDGSWQEFAYLYDEEKEKWLYSIIPNSNFTEMEFTSLNDALKERKLLIEFDKELEEISEKYAFYMKALDINLYQKNYESDMDFKMEVMNLLSEKKGIDNLIETITNDNLTISKNDNLLDTVKMHFFRMGESLIKELNKLKNERFQEKDTSLDDDIEII